MINIGSKQLKGISVGNRAVKEVYKGSQKIWSSASWKTIFTGSINNVTQQIPFKIGAGTLLESFNNPEPKNNNFKLEIKLVLPKPFLP